MQSEYKEPDMIDQELEHLELLYKDYGTAAMGQKTILTERDPTDITLFNAQKHGDELKKNLNLEGCPTNLHNMVTELIKQFWDAFAEEGMMKTIRGVKFHIDTGKAVPICCKQR
jgi:hypothetical protein